jgi:16S rRNA (guanine966-N2)-methyltransferase
MSSRHHKKSSRASGHALPSRVRIIGGRWRGVTLSFPASPTLRPTPDRVRETLFNWLQPVIVEARCLDLFAGSGALGIEALSRGAAEVEFVDSDPMIGRHLAATLRQLGVNQPLVSTTGALQFLDAPPRPFQVAFLDPPYAAGLLEPACALLAQGWLTPGAYIYLECPASSGLPALPPGWVVHRAKRAGQVGYHLLRNPTSGGAVS